MSSNYHWHVVLKLFNIYGSFLGKLWNECIFLRNWSFAILNSSFLRMAWFSQVFLLWKCSKSVIFKCKWGAKMTWNKGENKKIWNFSESRKKNSLLQLGWQVKMKKLTLFFAHFSLASRKYVSIWECWHLMLLLLPNFLFCPGQLQIIHGSPQGPQNLMLKPFWKQLWKKEGGWNCPNYPHMRSNFRPQFCCLAT